MSELSFFVKGIPGAQAGMRDVQVQPGMHRLITTGTKNLKPWRKAVTDVASYAANLAHWTILDGPVQVSLRFFMPMPKARPAWIRHAGIIYGSTKPDIDKLVRAMLDSITNAKVYADDARVAKLQVVKYEVANHAICGCEVVVGPLDNTDEVTQARLASVLAQRQSFAR